MGGKAKNTFCTAVSYCFFLNGKGILVRRKYGLLGFRVISTDHQDYLQQELKPCFVRIRCLIQVNF